MKMDPKTASAMESSGRRLYQAVPHDPELGPLTALPGKWVSQGRGWNIASNIAQLGLGISASKASSTAANAISAPAAGCPPRVTCTLAFTVWRT